MGNLNVSIIILDYGLAETVAPTIESVLAQSISSWEVIVVKNSSMEETDAIAERFAATDTRIRVIDQQFQQTSLARNSGIENANYDWLLFLDAGDWILLTYLECLTGILAENPQLDVAYCGWTRATPDAHPYGLPECRTVSGDLFDLLAEANPFALHACIIRRALVESVGKFDPTLSTQEDWDLWQRIARTGACFGGTDKVLALDRLDYDLKSANATDMCADAMRVLVQGHAPDPRVLNPHPHHAHGKSPERLVSLKLKLACTYAGLAIGAGEDFGQIFDHLQEEYGPEEISTDFMKPFLYALPIPTGHSLTEYHILWQRLESSIYECALALEARLRIPAFARRACLKMERVLLEQTVASRPITLGSFHAVHIELTESIPDFFPPPSVERLHCTFTVEREILGCLELPVFEGKVVSTVLVEAIATEFSDKILKLIAHHPLPQLDQFINSDKVKWVLPLSDSAEDIKTLQLPILTYHHVSPTGSAKFSRWRISPEDFEKQLRFLRDAGAYSITFEDWRTALVTQTSLPGRPILITFDDGYLDFATYAWPLLKRYGFSATVFVVVDKVGKTNIWDSVYYGEDLALLDWEQIKQLHTEGVEFGSHTLIHRPLTALSPADIVHEATQSRAILEQELGIPIKAFSYPYGDLDPLVQYLIGSCGYDVAVSCLPGHSSIQDPIMRLSRIDIEGHHSLQDFEKKLFPSGHAVKTNTVLSERKV